MREKSRASRGLFPAIHASTAKKHFGHGWGISYRQDCEKQKDTPPPPNAGEDDVKLPQVI
jgi:hypothetical protein